MNMLTTEQPHENELGESTVLEYTSELAEQEDMDNEADSTGDDEMPDEPSSLSFNPNDIDIRDQKLTVESLVKRLRNNRINLFPDYQRRPSLWSEGKQSRLIESILVKIPLPVFFFDASEDSWQVVDGLQRLSAIQNFALGDKNGIKLKLTGLEYLKELEGKTIDELPLYLLERFEETNITAYIINPGSPKELKYNIFKRINTGGLVLTPQEIRNALNAGIPSKFTKDLADLYEFKRATDWKIPISRMEDLEFVTRFASFYLNGNDYRPSWDDFLNRGLMDIGKLSDTEREKLKQAFKRSMNLSFQIFDRDAFRKRYHAKHRRRRLNKALFDVWSVSIAKLNETEQAVLLKRKVKLKQKFMELMSQSSFENALRSGDPASIIFRFKAIEKIIADTIHD